MADAWLPWTYQVDIKDPFQVQDRQMDFHIIKHEKLISITSNFQIATTTCQVLVGYPKIIYTIIFLIRLYFLTLPSKQHVAIDWMQKQVRKYNRKLSLINADIEEICKDVNSKAMPHFSLNFFILKYFL